MGTAGLVGVFGTIEASVGAVDTWLLVTGIVLLMFVLPAVLSWLFCLILRKAGWIKENDLKLELASTKKADSVSVSE